MVSLTFTCAESRARIARARELHEALAPILAQSRALVATSRDLCRVFRRRISGGSDVDAPLIVEVISKGPMCLECLAKRTGVPSSRITESLQRMGEFIAVTAEADRCGPCLRITTVYRLTDPRASASPRVASLPTRLAALTHTEAIWQFLDAHRGEMFCTQCLATALCATKRIDRAVLGAEGRGALRRYGICVKCGKDRLLCGLAR